MARSENENFAIRQKTEEMISLGYPTEQAQAIAFRMFRDGELIIPKMKLDRKTQQTKDKMRAARAANTILMLYQLAKRLSK
jgi:hypothetical protein